ncbi:MAG: hypothetical protein V1718_05570 [archaeon]
MKKAFAFNWIITGLIVGLVAIGIFLGILNNIFTERARQDANKQFSDMYTDINTLCKAGAGEETYRKTELPDIVEAIYTTDNVKIYPDDIDEKITIHNTSIGTYLCMKLREEKPKCKKLNCIAEVSYLGQKKTVLSLADKILKRSSYTTYPLDFTKKECGVRVFDEDTGDADSIMDCGYCGDNIIDSDEICDGNDGCSGSMVCKDDCSICESGPVLSFSVSCDPGHPADAVFVNTDKTLCFDGKKRFPLSMHAVCYPWQEGRDSTVSPCNPDTFTGAFNADSAHSGSTYSSAGIHGSISITNAPSSDSGFTFYVQPDEPADSLMSTVRDYYDTAHTSDPEHPVILNHWHNLMTWSQYADIITWDTYTLRYGSPTTWDNWDRDDFLYAWEYQSKAAALPSNDIEDIPKPVWAVLQANGISFSEGSSQFYIPTQKEARAQAYTAITTNVNGLGWWGNKVDSNLNVIGLDRDETVQTYFINLGKELTGLNDILILPSTDYSWEYRPGTMVSFSDKYTKSLGGYVNHIFSSNFNYMLKQNGATYYLIVVNKDIRPISDVDITISGLSGVMTARTIGLAEAGSVPGRTLAVTEGRFRDSFDGYAVHIYMIE